MMARDPARTRSQVSRDEALQHYLFENNTVQYDVVAFRPEAYRAAMRLTDADVERFLSTHGAEVEARYDADERTYKGVKPQLQLRQIFIAKLEETKPEAAPTPEPAQGSAAGSAAPAPAAGSAAEPKKDDKADAKKDDKKADEAGRHADRRGEGQARGRAHRDRRRQAEVHRRREAAQHRRGDEGQRRRARLAHRRNPKLGDKAVTDAVKTLKPGEMTPVITTDRGAYLVIAEDKREGDLTFDQVKHEIAKELARDVWRKEAAKRAALAALDKARGGLGLNLEQLYEKEQAPRRSPGGFDIEQIINDPNLTPEQKQQPAADDDAGPAEVGTVRRREQGQPAAWYAQADSPAALGRGSGHQAGARCWLGGTGDAGCGFRRCAEGRRRLGRPAAARPLRRAGSAAPAAGSAAPAQARVRDLPSRRRRLRRRSRPR